MEELPEIWTNSNTVGYYTEVTNSTTSLWTTLWTDYVTTVEDLGKSMKAFQGFREANFFWFSSLKKSVARRLSILVWKSNRREENTGRPPKEMKHLIKPKATSCRRWTNGRPIR